MIYPIKTMLVTFISLSSFAYPSLGRSEEALANIFPGPRDFFTPLIPQESDVVLGFGSATKAALPARRMKILVWNVYKGTESAFRHEFLSLASDRDLVVTQEIFLNEDMLDVFRSLPHFYFTTATSFFSGKENIRTGVANMGPVKPVFTKYIRTERLEPITNSPKMAIITSYPISKSDNKLTVVNLHSINFVSSASFRHEINRIYEAIKDLPSPLVFTGDFNTWNKDRKSILLEYAQKLKLNEAKFSPDARLTFNGQPLDHFLYTSDIKILSARVDKNYQGSDHKPLQIEIEYLNPALSSEELEQKTQE